MLAIALGDAAYSEANCAEQLTGEELDLLLISRQTSQSIGSTCTHKCDSE